jgi:hypothetical protein
MALPVLMLLLHPFFLLWAPAALLLCCCQRYYARAEVLEEQQENDGKGPTLPDGATKEQRQSCIGAVRVPASCFPCMQAHKVVRIGPLPTRPHWRNEPPWRGCIMKTSGDCCDRNAHLCHGVQAPP